MPWPDTYEVTYRRCEPGPKLKVFGAVVNDKVGHLLASAAHRRVRPHEPADTNPGAQGLTICQIAYTVYL